MTFVYPCTGTQVLPANKNLCQCGFSVTIQMKAFEQYFHVVLFITLCKVVLPTSVDKTTLVCG